MHDIKMLNLKIISKARIEKYVSKIQSETFNIHTLPLFQHLHQLDLYCIYLLM